MIVAEVSANHNNDLQTAIDTIRAAAKCGADAVKFQAYSADTMTVKHYSDIFRIEQGTLWDGNYLYELYERASMQLFWHEKLQEIANEEGIEFFSTPFDTVTTDYLASLNVPYYKIASFEITDIPLIKHAASKGKPIIISTGIATLNEIHDAVEACKSVGNHDITLLKCTSQYPSLIEDANLSTISDMRDRFGVAVGLSDHTMGYIVPLVSVSYGVTMIEKHFILDRSLGGPDASFSMEPDEFAEMVKNIRAAEASIGFIDYEMTEKKQKSRVFSRSLFAVKPIKKGEKFTNDNIRSIRPHHGLEPKYLPLILGATAAKDIDFATPLSWDMIEGGESLIRSSK